MTTVNIAIEGYSGSENSVFDLYCYGSIQPFESNRSDFVKKVTCSDGSSFVVSVNVTTDTEHETTHVVYYKKTQIVLIGFDLSDRDSYENMDSYIKTIQSEPYFNGIIAVWGNGLDEHCSRAVTQEEARAHFASMNPQIPYYEVYTANKRGINEMFEEVLPLWFYSTHPDANKNSGCDKDDAPAGKKEKRKWKWR